MKRWLKELETALVFIALLSFIFAVIAQIVCVMSLMWFVSYANFIYGLSETLSIVACIAFGGWMIIGWFATGRFDGRFDI